MYCAKCGAKRHRKPGTQSFYVKWKKKIGVRYLDTETGKHKATVAWYCTNCEVE